MSSNRHRQVMAAVALAAVAVAGARSLAAQVPQRPASPQPAARQPAVQQPLAQPGGILARYLVDSPQVLNLTPKQMDRIKKLRASVDSTEAPLRAQWQQITGGRGLRDLSPAERRQLAPRLQPIMQQLRGMNQAAMDSLDAVLTPQQQERLASLRAEYQRRGQARRGGPEPRP